MLFQARWSFSANPPALTVFAAATADGHSPGRRTRRGAGDIRHRGGRVTVLDQRSSCARQRPRYRSAPVLLSAAAERRHRRGTRTRTVLVAARCRTERAVAVPSRQPADSPHRDAAQ